MQYWSDNAQVMYYWKGVIHGFVWTIGFTRGRKEKNISQRYLWTSLQSAITLSQTIGILITIGTPNYRLSNKVRVEEDNDQVPNKTYNIFCLDSEGMDIVDFETCLATSISRNVYKGPMALGTTVACVTNACTWHNALLIERASFTKIMSSSKTTMEKEKKIRIGSNGACLFVEFVHPLRCDTQFKGEGTHYVVDFKWLMDFAIYTSFPWSWST